jgi:hypothetical protein
MASSAPKRRSVLMVWPWAVDILLQWTQEVRPLLARDPRDPESAATPSSNDDPLR